MCARRRRPGSSRRRTGWAGAVPGLCDISSWIELLAFFWMGAQAEIDKTYAEDSALWRIEQLFYFARRRWNEANTLKDEATSRDGLVGGPFIDPFPY